MNQETFREGFFRQCMIVLLVLLLVRVQEDVVLCVTEEGSHFEPRVDLAQTCTSAACPRQDAAQISRTGSLGDVIGPDCRDFEMDTCFTLCGERYTGIKVLTSKSTCESAIKSERHALSRFSKPPVSKVWLIPVSSSRRPLLRI